ncbi:MAG: NusG domain II-containing protein [Oscillospiraceae bacterium]|nr:NusG domain II-containing protein [Oscillospiraceae bacterium]
MLKTRTWVIILAAVLICAVGLSFWTLGRKADGTVANVYQDGVCIRSIDLSRVTESERIVIEGAGGTNTILVEPGRICIEAADCPDQVCVNTGWISDSAAPIVCLPHRLVVRIEGGAESDGAPDALSQ